MYGSVVFRFPAAARFFPEVNTKALFSRVTQQRLQKHAVRGGRDIESAAIIFNF